MFSSTPVVPKHRVPVVIQLDDGSELAGEVFVGSSQRLLDMLNDDRRFLAVVTNTGLMMLNKAAILRMSPIGDEPAQAEPPPLWLAGGNGD